MIRELKLDRVCVNNTRKKRNATFRWNTFFQNYFSVSWTACQYDSSNLKRNHKLKREISQMKLINFNNDSASILKRCKEFYREEYHPAGIKFNNFIRISLYIQEYSTAYYYFAILYFSSCLIIKLQYFTLRNIRVRLWGNRHRSVTDFIQFWYIPILQLSRARGRIEPDTNWTMRCACEKMRQRESAKVWPGQNECAAKFYARGLKDFRATRRKI